MSPLQRGLLWPPSKVGPHLIRFHSILLLSLCPREIIYWPGALLLYWLSYPLECKYREGRNYACFSHFCTPRTWRRLDREYVERVNEWMNEQIKPFSVPASISWFHSFKGKTAAGMEEEGIRWQWQPASSVNESSWAGPSGRAAVSTIHSPLGLAALGITKLLLSGKARGQLSLLHPQLV